MAATIQRGSTCRICFYPQGGLDVSTLGSPVISISQGDVIVVPDEVTVDSAHNRIYADLKEGETMQLVEGLTTKAQAYYVDEDSEKVYKFPIHDLIVEASLSNMLHFEAEDDTFYEPAETYVEIDKEAERYAGANPSELGLYEYDGSEYVLTSDTEILENKKYFAKE